MFSIPPLFFCGIFFGGAFLLSSGLSKAMELLCKKYHWLPSHDPTRWSKAPKPILGGVGIYASFGLTFGVALGLIFFREGPSFFVKNSHILIPLIGGSTFIFFTGLWDDLSPLRPHVKLVFQLIPACLALAFGVRIHLFASPILDIPLGIFWFVGITNAFNLLDNMDGLSSGIAGISAVLLFCFSWGAWPLVLSLGLAIFAGGTLGFLTVNFNPASIFMGDSGSQFIGFTLALLAIGGTRGGDFNYLLAPLLVLVVPIFDTTLVTFLRWIHGRRVFKGGTDHLSHRLVALGLSERKAVLLLYLITTLLGGILLFSPWIGEVSALLLSALSLVAMLYFLVFLSRVPVYHDHPPRGWRGTFGNYGFHILLVVLDVVLLSVAFVGAYFIRFEGSIPPLFFHRIFTGLPLFIALKIGVFIGMSLYQIPPGNLRYEHFKKITTASFVGSLLSVLLATMAWRFTHYSRAVFVIDWALTVILISSSRSLLQIYRDFFGVAPSLVLLGTQQSIKTIFEELDDQQKKKISGIYLWGSGELSFPGELNFSIDGSWEDLKKSSLHHQLLLLKFGLSENERGEIQNFCTTKKITLYSLVEFLKMED